MPLVAIARVAGLSLITVIALFAAGCSSSQPKVWVEETRELSLPAAGLEHLRITTHNGRIEVQGESGRDALQVVARCSAGGEDKASAREALAALEVVSHREGTTHKLSHRWSQPKHRDWGAAVAFTVTSLPYVALRATTHNGAVTVRDLEAETWVTTHNGKITLATAKAPVTATSHNGAIRATVSGDQVALHTHNGAVKVRLEGEGPIAGSVETHNGPIDVRVTEQRTARIVCRTANGPIKCRSPIHVERATKHRVEGTLGNGETQLSLRSHNGPIHVRP